MSGDLPNPRWQVIAASVQGVSHLRHGLPNQDAIAWQQAEAGLPLILTVADGHGSPRSFRSDAGARLAVAAALAEVGEVDRRSTGLDPATVKQACEEQLPLAIVRRWREAVEADLAAQPFSADELATMTERAGARAQAGLDSNPLLAYGATLLIAWVTAQFIVYLQLGDGDILSVSPAGEVYRPLAGDERLFANETTSLAGVQPWRDFRVTFQRLSSTPPALILLATDGYANSFRDEAAFLQVGSDFLALLNDDPVAVADNLTGWLNEASAVGSGDDVTVGLLYQRCSLPISRQLMPLRSRTCDQYGKCPHRHQTRQGPLRSVTRASVK